MKNKIYIIIFAIVFSIVIWGSVTLSEQYFSTITLKVNVINCPNGYTFGNINPEKVTLRVKANGWQLLNLNLNAGNYFYVSADNDSGMLSADLLAEVSENNWLGSGITVTDIFPRNISYKVEEIAFKKIKVEPVTELKFQSGYGLATPVKINPDSVLVSGPKSSITTIQSIKTQTVSLSSLDNKTSIITDLIFPAGFNILQKKAEITFDVQKIVEHSFDNIKVEILDISPDRSVVLIPNVLSVNLRGGVNILGKISAEEISAKVYYRDIVADTLGSIKPEIHIPQNTQLLFIKPDRLKYIIKKFE